MCQGPDDVLTTMRSLAWRSRTAHAVARRGHLPRPTATRAAGGRVRGLALLAGAGAVAGCASLPATGRPAVAGVAEGASVAGAGAAPTLAEALARADTALSAGALQTAEACYARAATLCPDSVSAQFGLAQVWVWRGVVDADAAALERAANVLAALAQSCPKDPGIDNLVRLVAAERARL